MGINAWRVQLHGLSQRKPIRVITLQWIIAWTSGASEKGPLAWAKNLEVIFYSFPPLVYHTSKPSGNPVGCTFQIYPEFNLSSSPPLQLPHCEQLSFPAWTVLVFCYSTRAPHSLWSTQLLEWPF